MNFGCPFGSFDYLDTTVNRGYPCGRDQGMSPIGAIKPSSPDTGDVCFRAAAILVATGRHEGAKQSKLDDELSKKFVPKPPQECWNFRYWGLQICFFAH